ncbi:SICA antigen [Plasmodium coatneyi]|uniref:SICA antigen n=1 Tax=Plasmodium coatneyi TaxID=208452 RepID=A0A1B1DTJ3_9APIC|nr:SICA antigen [Plasmodium coatneyi]ANQ05905.1 SICA antigen [Plasmodium coatneyi]
MKRKRNKKNKKKIKYFALLGKERERYRTAYRITGPTLEQQIVHHVDQDAPREYILVKERKPRAAPEMREKRSGRRRGVRRRMIIDIHLEVLDECQKGDLHSTKEDYFTIIIQEFMGGEFIKEEKVPSLDSGFRV